MHTDLYPNKSSLTNTQASNFREMHMIFIHHTLNYHPIPSHPIPSHMSDRKSILLVPPYLSDLSGMK